MLQPNDVSKEFPFDNGVILYPILFIFSIWIVYWAELRFGWNFTSYGVRPRTFLGLRGVVCSPFIHSDVAHLWHNTVPLGVLSAALFYFYRSVAWRALLWMVLLSGIGTWLIGRASYHIGMSGMIYAMVSFLFFKGVFTKHYRLVALSLAVVFIYGSLVWGTLPIDKTISWEGHLSGFVAGVLLAIRFRESVPKPIKYKWEAPEYDEKDDPFMQQFDEEGNFFELPKEEIEVVYDYKEEE